MTIEGLGKKFQEARLARQLTLDEAARMTKIRPSRLAEIEADDFSQFPSLAYAKGFILIYGKFLDVDVTPYMEAFEGSEAVTVDGYSYLQDNPAPKPTRARVVRHRPVRPSSDSGPTSLMPLVIGIVVLIVGFMGMRFILNIQRIGHKAEPTPAAQASIAPSIAPAPPAAAPAASAIVKATQAPAPFPPPPAQTAVAQAVKPASTPPFAVASSSAPPVAAVAPSAAPSAPAAEPEVRRAEPVRPEDLKKESAAAPAATAAGPNRVAIRPLKSTYLRVVVDDGKTTPVLERWISPNDGTVEFRGQHVAIRVVDRTAVQIRKNGKLVEEDDPDVTIE